MSRAQPRPFFAATRRAVASDDAIEWEELPSLASSLAQRLVQRGRWQPGPTRTEVANESEFMASTAFGAAWNDTLPVALDPAPVSRPFQEPLPGLSVREVFEPGVFQHFFGPNAAEG